VTATLRVLVYAHGETVHTGPEDEPIRARVLRMTILPGGSIRYELGYWGMGMWCTSWFPGSEVRPIDEEESVA
jgi:hypothetical protein